MKVIVINSLAEKHQEEIDKALDMFYYSGSPVRVSSLSTTSVVYKGENGKEVVGLTTVIALHDVR